MAVNNLQSIMLNNRGSGLPMVMVLSFVGIVAVASMSGALLGSGKMKDRRSNLTTYETFLENMKQTLEDPGACTFMLQDKVIALDTGAMTQVELDHEFDGDKSTNLAPNWTDAERSFEIGKVDVIALSDNFVRDIRPHNSPDKLFTYPVRVKIHSTKLRTELAEETDMALILERKEIFEKVPPLKKALLDTRLFVNVESAPAVAGVPQGRIKSCWGYKTDAAICSATGGTYDLGATNPLHKCKPDKRCFPSEQGLVTSSGACRAPYNSHISELGKINGQEQFLCNWCHPFAGATSTTEAPTGPDLSGAEDWLAEQWLKLAASAKAQMDAGTEPTDPAIAPLATEWDYLVQTTLENGMDTDAMETQYESAQSAVDSRDQLKLEATAARDEVQNLTWEVEDLEGELAAAKAAGMDSSQFEQDLADAKAQLAAAEAELAELEKQLAEAEEAVAALSQGGMTAEEFIDPINQVRQFLVTEYGIDAAVIDYMDEARGL